MCNPPRNDIIQKVVYHVTKLKLKALYVATDNDPMIEEFQEAFKSLSVWTTFNASADLEVKSLQLNNCDGV